jgi:hypothetical protein
MFLAIYAKGIPNEKITIQRQPDSGSSQADRAFQSCAASMERLKELENDDGVIAHHA